MQRNEKKDAHMWEQPEKDFMHMPICVQRRNAAKNPKMQSEMHEIAEHTT